MKKRSIAMVVFLFSALLMEAQQQNKAYLMLGDMRVAANDSADPTLLRNICSLQLLHPDWKAAVKPTSFQVVISSRGSIMKESCRAGSSNEKLSARLQQLKTGDLIFLDHFEIPESVRSYVGQYTLVAK